MMLARWCGDGFTEGMEMLEASRMDRTDVTQGDLEELCESSLSGNMRQEGVPSSNPGLLDLGFVTSPSGELLKPGEGSTHTPASVESASRTLTGFDVSACFSASWFSWFKLESNLDIFRDNWFGGMVGEGERG